MNPARPNSTRQGAAPTIVLAPDSGDDVGGGHVMRCLTLAGALQAKGATCAFQVGPAGRRLVETFAGPAMAVLDEAAPLPPAEVAVVDNYRLGAVEEARLRRGGTRIVVIDDLADRPHDCDLLIDSSFGREADDYAGLVPAQARRLVGLDYALVRPAFTALRAQARARRDGRPVSRALVSLGLTDLGAVTRKVVEAILPALGAVALDVVVGAGAASRTPLADLARADPRIRLHVDATDMERLTLEADAAIGAGGSSTWERACLGLPTVTVILADNQRAQALALAGRGLTTAVEAGEAGFAARLADAWRGLAGDGAARAEMSRRNFGICDGGGADRAAEAVLALAAR